VLSPLEPSDARLLERVQASVPLVDLPFAALADELATTEADVLARLTRLAGARILRQVSAIFDTRACGYASALVAARVVPEALERAAAVVCTHPGVSHCYERDHAWNLWFTLAVPPTSRLGLDQTVARLGAAAGAESVRSLPALRTFKIAAKFDVEPDAPGGAPLRGAGGHAGAGPGALGAGGAAISTAGAERRHASRPVPLTDEEIAVVRALQEPLAFVEEPFAAPARAAGMDQAELLAGAKALLDRGVMRRLAGLVNHRRAGFGANVMAAWALAAERIGAAGRRIAEFSAVTHCYERPVFDGWPFALFSMIHGRSREECVAVVAAIRAATDPEGVALLWTLREFKKTRLMLFTPDYDAWEASIGAGRP